MRNAIVATLAVLIATAASGQLVATRPSTQQFLIPAAGAQPGNGGTFFRSDVTIINYRGADQRVRFQWLPQDVSGAGGAAVEMTINATSGIASEDFVTNIMQRSGLGAILVTAIDANGAFDTRAQLVGTSRIWTPQPSSGGTTSQSLPSIATIDINSSVVAILGARRDTRYRTNVGIVNISNDAQTFQVVVLGESGPEPRQVTVQPLSMVLFGAPERPARCRCRFRYRTSPRYRVRRTSWRTHRRSTTSPAMHGRRSARICRCRYREAVD